MDQATPRKFLDVLHQMQTISQPNNKEAATKQNKKKTNIKIKPHTTQTSFDRIIKKKTKGKNKITPLESSLKSRSKVAFGDVAAEPPKISKFPKSKQSACSPELEAQRNRAIALYRNLKNKKSSDI